MNNVIPLFGRKYMFPQTRSILNGLPYLFGVGC